MSSYISAGFLKVACNPRAFDMARKISQSALAEYAGGIALLKSLTRLSVFVNVPSFSANEAAGNMTSA